MGSESTTIAPTGGTQYNYTDVDLDERFYDLDDDEMQFLMQQTGIKDPDDLKKYVIAIQREVYIIHPYPCIRLFHFVKLKARRYSVYNDVLQIAGTHPGALFLDIGCGVGNDTRRLVADGWPAHQVIASDLRADFWDVGHKVFKSTPESFPVTFVPGDVFDDAFLAPTPLAASEVSPGPVDLSATTTLTALRGRLAAVHASSFFHLFNEAQQTALAYRLASLLAHTPGSTLFGGHVGRPEKGLLPEWFVRPNTAGVRMFCHSPESFVALWETVFGPGKVLAKAAVKVVERKDLPGYNVKDDAMKYYHMSWSVRRL